MMPTTPGIRPIFWVRVSTVGTYYVYFEMGVSDRGKGYRFFCIWVLTWDMTFPESGPFHFSSNIMSRHSSVLLVMSDARAYANGF